MSLCHYHWRRADARADEDGVEVLTLTRASRLFAALMFTLAGCTGTIVSETFTGVGEELDPACVQAVEAAAAVDSMQDTVEDLDESISVCPSLAVLRAVSDLFPNAFDGASVLEFVRNRCALNDELASSAVCEQARQ